VSGEPIPARDEGPLAPLRVDVLATVLHRQAADARELLEFLAERLARALPEAVKVSRRGPFWTGRVNGVRVVLPGVELELRLGAAGTLEALLCPAVGGVVLRHDPVTVERWIEELAAALGHLAEQSESTRYALRSILL